MLYFEHDTSAGNDGKIIALRMECGGAAVDAYWFILELMYRDESDLDVFNNRYVTNSVCHGLCVGSEKLFEWVNAMIEIELFDLVDEKLHSDRVSANIAKYQQKAETARQNGKKGGRKPTRKPSKNPDETNAETQIKANKRKEKKSIGSFPKEKEPNTYARDGAAVGEATPLGVKERLSGASEPVTAHCPTCGASSPFSTSHGEFCCPEHGPIARAEVDWQ